MADKLALKPVEAAHIAANVYFTLEGWEATYKFREMHGADAKGAPKPKPGLASSKVVRKNVTGSGPVSVAKAGIDNGKVVKSFAGSTGSNLLGRTRSGLGYMLQFERDHRKHLVIATRGTRPEMGYPDLLTDANISTNREMPDIGPVHAGFYDVFNSLQPTLTAALNTIRASDVVHCVGHSLGGAVANLIAIHLASMGANVRLYTFGAPRVGLRHAMYDVRAAALLGEDHIYRVSHNFDPIPMIPVAPYIHVLPSIRDRNNIFIGSPSSQISIDNHDTAEYIRSVSGKTWQDIRADKLMQGYLDKQYFLSWRTSESWLKRYLGETFNAKMASLQRVLQGLIDTVGIGFTEIATILDLLAVAIRKGINAFNVAKNYVVKFIGDCAKMFGVAREISRKILSKLLDKLMAELTIAAKLAIKKAAKVARSTEFSVLLSASVATSIGVLLI